MQAHTAGKAKGRYICPISGRVTTLGLRWSVQLTEPMRLVFMPGWSEDGRYREPDPTRGPDWTRAVRYQRGEPTESEQKYLDRAAGRVLGPGCVTGRGWEPPGPDHPLGFYGQAGVYLLPVSDSDPGAWFVNEPLKYKKCAGCTSRVAVTERTTMARPWSPRHPYYYRHRRALDINPGPHPAGTVACDWCDPRKSDEQPF